MTYVPKTTIQTFQSSWQKTVAWADTNKLPRTAWYPVYQLDATRMKNGYGPMPMADRLNAILASGNPNDVTPLPTDAAKPVTGGNVFSDIGHFFSNSVHDLENIFTGLNPIHLGPALYDMAKNTIEHPGWLLDPKKDTLAQLIPGVSVIGQIEQHGIGSLAGDPISSLLDVLPIADGMTSLVGHAGSFGDAVARTAGYTTGEQMAKAGTIRTIGSAIGNVPIAKKSTMMTRDLAGDPVLVRETVKGRLNKALNKMGFSPQVADAYQGLSRTNVEHSAFFSGKITHFNEVANAAGVPAIKEARDLLVSHTYPDWASLMNSPMSLGAKNVLTAWRPIMDWIQEDYMAAGEWTKVKMPDGTIEMYSNKSGVAVINGAQRFEAAQKELEDKSVIPDRIRREIDANDARAIPLFAKLETYGTRIGTAMRQDATQAATQLLGFKPNATVVRLLDNVFSDGGLLHQAQTAVINNDFAAFQQLSKEMHRVLNLKSLTKSNSPLLASVRDQIGQLHDWAKIRLGKEGEFRRRMEKADFGVLAATKKVDKARAEFEQLVHDNPSQIWQPLFVEHFIAALMEHEEGIKAMENALHKMGKDNLPHETIQLARENPQQLMDLVTVMLRSATESPFFDGVDQAFVNDARESAYDTIAELRATGNKPFYAPTVSTKRLGEDPFRGSTHITIPFYKPRLASAADEMFDTTDTVHDLQAATNFAGKEIVRRNAAVEFIENHVLGKLTFLRSDLVQLVTSDRTLAPELAFGKTVLGSQDAAINDILSRRFNLTTFDPYSYGHPRTTPAITEETHYIDKDILKGIEDSLDKGQKPDLSVVAKGTKVFRMAILGLSPRYTAHILLGGTFLMAIRNPLALAYIPQAFKMVRDPEKMARIAVTSTQRGAADVEFQATAVFLESSGRQLANLLTGEYVSKGMSKAAAVANINFKFTNWVTNMQRAMVYLDASKRAGRKTRILDPHTGVKVSVTPARAHEEGMRAVDKVMGDVTHMTPLERNIFTKLMPFYGWTKHILTYVASYPLDHPYKALVLSRLADINSADVPLGLPLRIQNLFFLGKPDPFGNVSAIDARSLNPLRDTANYFSLSGWLSALNPAITSVLTLVNPQMTYGDNVLYPNITYDRLYGINVAGPQGNLLTAAEQYVPQIGVLDAAMQLSSQYKNLKTTNPALFAKTIFEALNIPFAQVQQVNLKQIAAKQEMDRFNQAKNVAAQYFQSPTPQNASTLQGYTSLPNPLNPLYQLSPAELEAIAMGAMQKTGLPASETIAKVENPTNL